MNDRPTLVLIAGPCRSGAGGDPAAMAADPARLEAAAWPVFAAGHLPVTGEWIAPPVPDSPGAGPAGPLAGQVPHPTTQRLLTHCDTVLRLPADSAGAGQDVATGHRRGLPVCHDVGEIPRRALREAV
jgi:hypothetical protein